MPGSPMAQGPRAGEAEDPLPTLLTFFKALAHPARLRVVGQIAAGPLTAAEIGRRTGLSLKATIAHLAVLLDASLVRLEGAGVAPATGWMRTICARWPPPYPLPRRLLGWRRAALRDGRRRGCAAGVLGSPQAPPRVGRRTRSWERRR